MKIDDVSLTLFSWDDLPEIVYGPNVRQLGGSSALGLLEIKAGGLSGHAFLGASGRTAKMDADILIDRFKPSLMGANALEREKIHQGFGWRGRSASIRSLGAVDVALWDLAGKAAGLPIHQLIGTYRTKMPAYASSPAHATIEGYCDEAVSWKERGVMAYKIHARGRWREDVEIASAVRNAVGPDVALMMDSGWAYDYPAALNVGRALDELKFTWLEDPLGEWSIASYQKLKAKIDTPVMATELPFAGLEMYQPWLLAQATDYLRGDVAFKGGITPVIKTAHLAEAFSMNYEIHHGSNSLNNIANLHVGMAIRNSDYYEYLLPEAVIKYGLVEDIEVDSEGFVHAPMKPGLGVDIDFDLIARKKIAELR